MVKPPSAGKDSTECVRVLVRCRPLSEREKFEGASTCIKMDTESATVEIRKPGEGEQVPPKQFTFDAVYYLDSITEQIYNMDAFPLIDSVAEGYNGTIFAYGQTGSGKTFTMQGVEDVAAQKGIIPRAFEHLFKAMASGDNQYLIHASYTEIYNEEVRDLLGDDYKKKLPLREEPKRGVYIEGVSMHRVMSVKDCEKVMAKGWKNRAVGETSMNEQSSRSHSIFTINVESMRSENHIRAGKLNMVDLAGSERQSRTEATGDRFKEATNINLSLSALGNVISALVESQKITKRKIHIPYRDSKLTRLLQDSLGGNTKTLMVACISPASDSYDETLSTLRYADRAKQIKNKPKINEDPKDALLRQYQEEIEKLKALLASTEINQTYVEDPEATQKRIDEAVRRKETEVEEKYKEKIKEMKVQLSGRSPSKAANELEVLEQNKIKEIEDIHLHAKSRPQSSGEDDDTMSPSEEATMLQIAGRNQKLRPSIIAFDDNSFLQQVEHSLKKMETAKRIRISNAFMDKVRNVVTDSSIPFHGKVHMYNKMIVERLNSLEKDIQPVSNSRDYVEFNSVRKRMRREADERRKRIRNAIEQQKNDEIFLSVYDNMKEELLAKTKLLFRARDKVKMLEQEIDDVQSEFELDRLEYLECIRNEQKQTKLYSQMVDKMQPLLKRDCNYYNTNSIKSQAKWLEYLNAWQLPPVTYASSKLPAALFTSKRNAPTDVFNVPAENTQGLVPITRLFRDDSESEIAATEYMRAKTTESMISKYRQDAEKLAIKENHRVSSAGANQGSSRASGPPMARRVQKLDPLKGPCIPKHEMGHKEHSIGTQKPLPPPKLTPISKPGRIGPNTDKPGLSPIDVNVMKTTPRPTSLQPLKNRNMVSIK